MSITPLPVHQRNLSISSLNSTNSNETDSSSSHNGSSSNLLTQNSSSISSQNVEKRTLPSKPIVVDSLVSFFSPQPLPPNPKLSKMDFLKLFEARKNELYGVQDPQQKDLNTNEQNVNNSNQLDGRLHTRSNSLHGIAPQLERSVSEIHLDDTFTNSLEPNENDNRNKKIDLKLGTKQIELEIYSSFSMFEEIAKLCQELFIQEKTNTLQVRLAHMLSKLWSFELENVLSHINYLNSSKNDPWMLRFMRQWVKEWCDIEKEKKGNSNTKQRSSNQESNQQKIATIWEMLEEASEYVHFDNGNRSLISFISKRRKSPIFLKTRVPSNKKELSIWRQREISVMTMIINLYILREDFLTASRLSNYLRDYCTILSQNVSITNESKECDNENVFSITNGLLASIYTIDGRISLYLGRLEEAKNTFESIKKIDKDSHWLLLNESMILFSRREYENCLSLLLNKKDELEGKLQKHTLISEIRSIKTQLCEISNNIAVCYYFSNRLESAIKTLEDFLRIDPVYHSDILTVSNLCKFYELQSDVGSIHKKKTIKKLVNRYRTVDYPLFVYSLVKSS